MDLSSDETDDRSYGAAAVYQPARLPALNRIVNRSQSSRPAPFVDISDDESDQFDFSSAPLSSTIRKSQHREESMKVSMNESNKSGSSSVVAPEVVAVNSLKEKQLLKPCMQGDVINSITQRYLELRNASDQKIKDAKKTLVNFFRWIFGENSFQSFRVASFSNETAQQEMVQQRRIDDAVASLQQCIILDEEEEEDEFPPLTPQQQQIVNYGLHGGPRGEQIITKFNMTITRNDLITLDGITWLNDEVINFYMELIKHRSEQVDFLPKVHVMNTFFVGKLQQQGHSGVRRWTRKVDIFSVDVIPVPVHVGRRSLVHGDHPHARQVHQILRFDGTRQPDSTGRLRAISERRVFGQAQDSIRHQRLGDRERS